jgi:hypothetical protein
MEYLWFLVLGLGVVFLMSHGRGRLSCCGGGHDDHHSGTSENEHSSGREPGDLEKDVIDLRDDEYTIITPKHQRLGPSEGTEPRGVRP